MYTDFRRRSLRCYVRDVSADSLTARLGAQAPLILDGPTGSELERGGFQSHETLWTARAAELAPSLLYDVHRSYLDAGADLLTANTFRTTAWAAEQAGFAASGARGWLARSVAIAREACAGAPGPRWVLGSMAPLADCYHPQKTPPDAILRREHARTAEWLAAAGCDGILIETQGSGREAQIAVAAAQLTGLPVLVSFLPDPSPGEVRLLGGDPLRDCAEACLSLGAAGVLVNCAHVEVLARALSELRPLRCFIGAYANAARMVMTAGEPAWIPDEPDVASDALVRAGVAFWRGGARLLGACCGFGPDALALLAQAIKQHD